MRKQAAEFLIAVSLLGPLASPPALAALGGDATSVEADRVNMKGALHSTAAGTTAGPYTVHEIQGASGTTVREYAGADGKVFAVSWRGPVKPDLRQTLGVYFDAFQLAATGPHAGHRQLSVRQDNLVVESGGRMRAFYGRAYLPGHLPANLTPESIR